MRKRSLNLLIYLNTCSNRCDFVKVNLTVIYLWLFNYIKRVPDSGTWNEWLVVSTPKAWGYLRNK